MSIPATQSAGRRDNIMLPLAASQTFKTGAFVYMDGSGNITECGADPATIYGLSEEPAGNEVTDGTKILVGRATEEARWWIQCTSAPAAANRGVSYGIVKGSDGVWLVDFTDTTNTRVYVHQVDTDTNRVEISVLAANRQIAP